MFNFSQDNTFEAIMQRCLDRIDDKFDKRQGSIIYDALAPACAEIAQCYISLDVYSDQTYLLTATGSNLDNKAADYGVIRTPATKAQRLGVFQDNQDTPAAMSIDIGTRFSIPNEYGGYNFKVIEGTETAGTYILECETAGSLGNEYFGTLLPLQSVNNLGSAELTEIYIAGEDAEEDDKLRNRILAKLNETPFGGNVEDYKEYVESISGIGACLVIPVWNGGGTVKLVILTNSYEIPTDAKVSEVQTLVDPVANSGQGIGKAPIGHHVTVTKPTAYDLTITADVSPETGYTLASLEDDIKDAINDYIDEKKKTWTSGVVTIYVSRIIEAILSVDGVANTTNVQINGDEEDITINALSEGNPFPVVEGITLNET